MRHDEAVPKTCANRARLPSLVAGRSEQVAAEASFAQHPGDASVGSARHAYPEGRREDEGFKSLPINSPPPRTPGNPAMFELPWRDPGRKR